MLTDGKAGTKESKGSVCMYTKLYLKEIDSGSGCARVSRVYWSIGQANRTAGAKVMAQRVYRQQERVSRGYWVHLIATLANPSQTESHERGPHSARIHVGKFDVV